MPITHLFAGVAVSDFAAARRWYEALFGRPPDMLPKEGEAVWHVTSFGSVYVTADPARAGSALVTIAVFNLDEHATALAARGLSLEELGADSSALYEAFGRGDMAALAEVMADDLEWVNPGDPDDNPNAGTFKGKEAVLGWFGGLASTRDYTTFEPREFIAQNDKVVSLVYAEATVRDTGRAFVNHEAHVWTFRDGKLARFQIYLDTAAAAAAHRVE